MTAMSDYLEEQFLHWVLDGTVYLGLSLGAAFTDASYAAEASGGGYSRVQLVDAFTIADAGGGQWQGVNTSGVCFDPATAPWSDDVYGIGIFDAASGDNFLIHAALASPLTVYTGNVVYFHPGDIVIEAQ